MASHHLRKYAVAATVDFELYELDGTDLKTDAASATGDVTLYRDEAAVETLDADAFVDEGAIYSLALSSDEMTAARIIVCIVDQTSPKAWLDKTLIIETYGNASAQHAFDLDTATQNVNVASIDNIDFGATMKASINTEVDTALNTAIPAVNTADSINDILLDTLGTDVWATAARTLTDLTGFSLSAAGVDSIWDEVIEGASPTARQAMRLFLSALASKLSGAGSGTLVFRDFNDTKDRITATVDVDNNRTVVATVVA